MDGEELRIVIMGKTAVGKTAVGNLILGENGFKEEHSLEWGLYFCQREEKVIHGRRFVLIDTPGIFDSDMSEEDLMQEIMSFMSECTPGPHVFILVMEVARYTSENHQVVENLLKYFSDDVFSHMVLLFTHGEDLDDNMSICDFINKSAVEEKKSGIQTLKDLAERCGNRVHVVDNKYWNENSRDLSVLATLQWFNLSDQALREITDMLDKSLRLAEETPWFNVLSEQYDNVEAKNGDESEVMSSREYRQNKFQLTQLMKSVKTILRDNKGRYYRNEAFIKDRRSR
uniref:AIG1-type G domain-containing protein n=1 Tax=Astyanax mexicanus TaxID=7994 RepID=A0A8B9HN15_ASTMX